MEFTNEPIESSGTTLLEMDVESKLGFKTPLVFRILKTLQQRGYLPSYGCHMAELCLEESLVNAMVHGNKNDETKNVYVHVFGDDDGFGIIIGDDGEGFGPEDLPDWDDPEQLLRERGRGIMIIDHYMEAVRYNRGAKRLGMFRKRQTEPDPGAKPPPEPVLPARMPEDGVIEVGTFEPFEHAASSIKHVDLPDELSIDQPQEAPTAGAGEMIGPVSVRRVGNVVVATVHQRRVVEETIQPLRQALEEVAGQAEHLVVDLGQVDFMSSIGIGAIVVLRKQIAAKKGILILCSLQPAIENVFNMMGLHKLVPFEADPDAALEKINST